MQEWIIAMLVISVLLVLRDMAKVFFRGRSFLKAEQPAEEKNPQKEKVERYAASFRKLADSFYGLPYRKDYLSNGQVDGIIRETCDEICSHCYQREICWGTQSQEMYRGSERMIRSMEEGNQEKIQETKSDWMSVCSRFSQYYETLGNLYEGAAEADMGQPDDRKPPCRGTATPGDVQNHGYGGRRPVRHFHCGSSAYDGIAEDSQEASYCGEAGLGDG